MEMAKRGSSVLFARIRISNGCVACMYPYKKLLLLLLYVCV